MFLPDGCNRGTQTNGKLAINHRSSQVDFARRIERLVQCLGNLVDHLLVRSLDTERKEAKPRFREDGVQVRARGNLGLELLGQHDAVADVGLQARYAVGAHDEPQLQRAESAAQRDLPVAVVGDEVAIAELVAQVGRLDAQRRDEVAAAADPDGGAVKGGEHPLVRVEVERVEAAKVRGQRLVLVEQQRGAGVGGVDVHPDFAVAGGLVVGEGVRDAGKVVDGADVGGAEGGGQVKGLEAPGAQLGQLGRQRGARHGEAALLGDGDGVEAHAEDLGSLFRARVRSGAAQGHKTAAAPPQLLLLVVALGQVGGDLGEVLVAAGAHDGEDGLGGAAVQDAAAVGAAAAEEALGQAERLGEPVQDDRLELGDGRRADPVKVRAVEGVGPHLGNVGRVAGRAGEEGHEARARPVRDARHDLGVDVGRDGVKCLRLGGRRVGEERPQVAGLDIGDDAARGDAFVVIGDCEKESVSLVGSRGRAPLRWSGEAKLRSREKGAASIAAKRQYILSSTARLASSRNLFKSMVATGMRSGRRMVCPGDAMRQRDVSIEIHCVPVLVPIDEKGLSIGLRSPERLKLARRKEIYLWLRATMKGRQSPRWRPPQRELSAERPFRVVPRTVPAGFGGGAHRVVLLCLAYTWWGCWLGTTTELCFIRGGRRVIRLSTKGVNCTYISMTRMLLKRQMICTL